MVEQAKMKISVLLRVLLKGQNHDSENNYNSESRRDRQIQIRIDTYLIFFQFCSNYIQTGIYKDCQQLENFNFIQSNIVSTEESALLP